MGLFDSLFGSDEPSATVREPAFDDLYYPAAPQELRQSVLEHLEGGSEALTVDGETSSRRRIRGIISPHAEYAFAGDVMGAGWQLIRREAPDVDTVVVVGSSERVPFQGVATSQHGAFRTPLGEVAVQTDVIDRLLSEHPGALRTIDVAFDPDPSIEAQLPFAQVTCDDPSLVPLLIGDGDVSAMTRVIDDALALSDGLLVTSANLSEGKPREEAVDRDRRTADAIESLDGSVIDRDASSARMALQATIRICEARDWSAACHRLTTSEGKGGEIAGKFDKVTGYGAFSLRTETSRTDD